MMTLGVKQFLKGLDVLVMAKILELTNSQLETLKMIIEGDIFLSEQDLPNYKDEQSLTYYLDRCQVYNQILEELTK